MKLFVPTLIGLALFVSNIINSQEKLSITATVVNVTSSDGKVGFALYDKENFLKKPILASNVDIVDGKSTVTFKDVTPGDYAIVCYHDKNSNDKMDFATNGMPLEDYGSSNNIMNFGPPTFDNAKFKVSDKNVSLEIKF